MNIILYKTSVCPWCHKTEELLKKHKIRYKAINVGENPKAANEMIEKSGQLGVPVIDIDGKIVVGFDEPKLRKLLKIAS